MYKKLLIRLLPIAVAAFFLLDGSQMLSLDNIREHRQALMDFTDRHYLLMLTAIGYSLSTALSLPGGTVLSQLPIWLKHRANE